ncbi:hypothetical protein LCGC14_2940720 [marine sediment metagenome]|uniref:Uncharacterized protein n=1 Tax=marine sediment metagenome TaxID=412755 RepID=A0A0F8XIM6_9ZZZZ
MNLSTLFGGSGETGGGVGASAGISAIGGLAQIFGGIGAQRQSSQNARLLKRLGLLNAEEDRRAGRALQSAQIAASTTPDFGSALDIQLDDAVETEIGVLRREFGFDAQAEVAEAQGRSALISSLIRGSSTILGGFQRDLAQNPKQRTP